MITKLNYIYTRGAFWENNVELKGDNESTYNKQKQDFEITESEMSMHVNKFKIMEAVGPDGMPNSIKED